MCPRKDRLPNGVSTSLTIASATAETSASGGTIEAKLSEVYKHVGKILTGFRLVLCSPCLICGRCCARRSCRLSWAVEEHSSSKLLTVLRPATRPRRLSVYRPGGCSRLAHDEFRFDRNFRDVLYSSLDAFEQSASRDLAHSVQGLSYRGEGWSDKAGALNIVEADHGHVLRYTKARFLKSTDRTDGRNIVVGE